MSGYAGKRHVYETRAAELVAKMTLEEAASQLRYDAPAIKRLGVPAYNWWSEGLHGLARSGTATVFPQAIAMAATFDEGCVSGMAHAAAIEARAKHNALSRRGDRGIYKGLTIFSPNINILRDPRWGRGQETYGEDPYLTSRMGLAYISAMQGDGEYMLCAACAKHFVAHSGPEAKRHGFDAVVSPYDMEDTYLPAFEAAVRDGGAAMVMGAYNRTNGEPCCGSPTLMRGLLRDRWGFAGCFVSDCWAIRDFHESHRVTSTAPESAALALNNTCDLNCGSTYLSLLIAHGEGLASEEAIREAAVRVMGVRYALGMFDEGCPHHGIPYGAIDCDEHNLLALECSRRSKVLLKNNGILPLDVGKLRKIRKTSKTSKTSKIRKIAVIGPTADSREVLRGNYAGTPSRWTTILEGLRDGLPSDVRLFYAMGSHLFADRVEPLALPGDRLAEAYCAAAESDVAVLCLGLDATVEGEQGDTGNSEAGGDRMDLQLPACQRRLLDAVLEAGKPVVLVVSGGGAFDLSDADGRCDAIVMDWYGGAMGGQATAELLLGRYSPSGRLPLTFPRRTADLPPFEDYGMAGRTYRYAEKEPLYPFGYGLSYTSFEYSGLWLSSSRLKVGEPLCVRVTVENTGELDAEEVVQAYVRHEDPPYRAPRWALCGFSRVAVPAGQRRLVEMVVAPRAFTSVGEDGARACRPGSFTIYVGGHQPDARSRLLSGSGCLSEKLAVAGGEMQFDGFGMKGGMWAE